LRIKGTKNLSDLCVSAVKKGDRRGAEGAEVGPDLVKIFKTTASFSGFGGLILYATGV
jgi:hypothetical protein